MWKAARAVCTHFSNQAAFLVGAFDAVPPLPPTCTAAAVTDITWRAVPGTFAPSVLSAAEAWRPAAPPPHLVWLDDGTFRVGINLRWGGAVSELRDLADHVALVYLPDGRIELGPGYARLPGALPLVRDPNLLNDHDTGRSIQQSYYGSPPGYAASTYNGHPWPWNPVQGGDRYGDHSLILAYHVTQTRAYVEAEPLDWALHDRPAAAILQEWYALQGRSLTLTMRLTTFTRFLPRPHDQELPAAYVDSALHRFAYAAAGEHGGVRVVSVANPGSWFPDYADHTYSLAQGWSAWTDPTGWGVGLCTPGVPRVLAGSTLLSPYDPSQAEGGHANPTDYVAPVRALVLPSFGTLTYRTRVAVGTVGEIQAACQAFAAQHGQPGLKLRSDTVAPPP